MEMGNDNWKWALVIVLLAVFIFFGTQAYQSFKIATMDYSPPDDYLKGDSYDMQNGIPDPALAQTPEVLTNNDTQSQTTPPTQVQDDPSGPEVPEDPAQKIKHEENPDWTKIQDPFATE